MSLLFFNQVISLSFIKNHLYLQSIELNQTSRLQVLASACGQFCVSKEKHKTSLASTYLYVMIIDKVYQEKTGILAISNRTGTPCMSMCVLSAVCLKSINYKLGNEERSRSKVNKLKKSNQHDQSKAK